MIDDVVKDADKRMLKAVETYKNELGKVRSGRAHPSLLDHVKVECYGSEMPLSQVASVNVLDARTLTVSPWDKNMVKPIEKAILNSDLGLNPMTAGDSMRIPLPPLTEERRKDLIRVVKGETEDARVAIRNVRRDALQQLKTMVKNKEVSEDDERRGEERIQTLTDNHIKSVELALSVKEKELMEI